MSYSNALADEISSVLIADDLRDVMDLFSLKINRAELPVQISAENLFCEKTGKPIAKRDISAVFSSVKIHGKEPTLCALWNAHGLSVAPSWLFTDSDSLDKLIDADPQGYAVYAFGLLTDRHYQKAPNLLLAKQPVWARRSFNPERHYALARAYALLSDMPPLELQALAAECCHVLSFASDTVAYIARQIGRLSQSPDNLALLARNGQLIDVFKKSITAALEGLHNAADAIERAKFDVIPSNVSEMTAKTPSQVKGQKRSKRAVNKAEIEHFAFIMAALGNNPLGEKPKPNAPFTGEAWNMMELNAASFKKIDFETLGEFDDDDEDNEVEIRSIPRSQLPSVQRAAERITENQKAAQSPRLSFAARLAPKPVPAIPENREQLKVKTENAAPKAFSFMSRLGVKK